MRKLSKLISIGPLFTLIAALSIFSSGCAGKNANVSLIKDAEAKLNSAAYVDYEGKYELAPNFIITITKKGDSLFAQATGQGAAEIYPESEDKFYYKVVAAKIKFNRNPEGKVDSLTLFQNGQEMMAKKISI